MKATAPPASAEEQALARHRDELRQRFPMPEPAPRPARKARLIGVGLLLVAATLYWADPAYRREHYATTFAQRQAVTLADGSQVTLDSDTRLTVSWHLRSRRVALDQGQALFDVSTAWTRPFQVRGGGVEVNVLGTLFNVSLAAQSTQITLLRGRVQVASPQGSAQLLPGQQVVARAGRLQAVTRVDAEAASAWTDNRLVFQRTPLGQVLEQIQRYRRAPIRLDDPSLAELPITGVFDSSNVEALLGLLPSFLPLALASEADGTLHVRRKPPKK